MFQPLDQVRSIVASALNPNAKIRKSFRNFIMETMILIILILTTYGKINFLSFARHGKSWESLFRQNSKKEFDWSTFNSDMHLDASGHMVVVVLDHSLSICPERRLPVLDGIGPCVPMQNRIQVLRIGSLLQNLTKYCL